MSEKPGIFTLATINIKNEVITHLIDFSPTNDQLTMFQFFINMPTLIQYGLLIVNPSFSRKCKIEMRIINETSSSTNYIIVVDAQTPEVYRLIGTGEFATWSFK
ncbi:MAG: hypothetical protein CM1200mP38_7880 [Dehalococcoidia bacterium]|nr:MAG: hypothetical protein CM1200mP38_7880 [Dehalococcoidia bacterium]